MAWVAGAGATVALPGVHRRADALDEPLLEQEPAAVLEHREVPQGAEGVPRLFMNQKVNLLAFSMKT